MGLLNFTSNKRSFILDGPLIIRRGQMLHFIPVFDKFGLLMANAHLYEQGNNDLIELAEQVLFIVGDTAMTLPFGDKRLYLRKVFFFIPTKLK